MTMLLTLSIIVFGILTYNQLAVNDLPAVDYPVISSERLLSGRQPGDDGEYDRDAARETVHANSRLSLITSSSTQGNTHITLQFDLSKSIDAAATDVQSAIQRAHRTTAQPTCRARRLSPKQIRTISRSCISP